MVIRRHICTSILLLYIEIQPDGRSSDLDIVTIYSTVGAVAFLLVIGIVAVLACICYYVRKSSDIINTKKESDV